MHNGARIKLFHGTNKKRIKTHRRDLRTGRNTSGHIPVGSKWERRSRFRIAKIGAHINVSFQGVLQCALCRGHGEQDIAFF